MFKTYTGVYRHWANTVLSGSVVALELLQRKCHYPEFLLQEERPISQRGAIFPIAYADAVGRMQPPERLRPLRAERENGNTTEWQPIVQSGWGRASNRSHPQVQGLKDCVWRKSYQRCCLLFLLLFLFSSFCLLFLLFPLPFPFPSYLKKLLLKNTT